MNKKNLFFLFLILLWMGVIYILSDMTSIDSNKKSKEIVNQIVDIQEVANESVNISNNNIEKENINKVFRKCAHAFVYLVLCILILIFIFSLNINYKNIYYYVAILCCFIYACTDEVHQLFVDGRTGQFIDVLIDMLGSIIGCIIFILVRKRRMVE